MEGSSALLAAVSSEPASTSEIYARVGYLTLTKLGLVPYTKFRSELARLAAAGRLESRLAADGSTLWVRVEAAAER